MEDKKLKLKECALDTKKKKGGGGATETKKRQKLSSGKNNKCWSRFIGDSEKEIREGSFWIALE